MVALPPAAIVPRSQLKSGPAPIGPQDPWLGLIEPWLKPVGQPSPTVTLVASDGPPLETRSVSARAVVPAVTLARPSVKVTARSAAVTMSVRSVALTSAGFASLRAVALSLTGLLTETISVWGPPAVLAGTV